MSKLQKLNELLDKLDSVYRDDYLNEQLRYSDIADLHYQIQLLIQEN